MGKKRTLLLVNNSASSLFYWGMLLKRFSYRVISARNGLNALREMELNSPSIVLTDASLPDMTSADFLAKIKNAPRFRNIPVIMLAAGDDQHAQEECQRIGFAGWLPKEVEPDVLYRTLQSLSEPIPRKYFRMATSLTAVIGDGTVVGGTERTEQVTALSEGGMFVRTLYPQPQNAMTPVRLKIGDREVRAKAVVLYRSEEQQASEPGMGMKFVEISDDDRAVIRKFIKQELTRDIAR
ncbi:MAG: response regulator [Nitrospiraceae bacterium]|nr:response regulator [Nitrospiraceae bacterium]